LLEQHAKEFAEIESVGAPFHGRPRGEFLSVALRWRQEQSGWGRENGAEVLNNYTEFKIVTAKL